MQHLLLPSARKLGLGLIGGHSLRMQATWHHGGGTAGGGLRFCPARGTSTEHPWLRPCAPVRLFVRTYVPQLRKRRPLSPAKLLAKKEKKVLRQLTKRDAKHGKNTPYAAEGPLTDGRNNDISSSVASTREALRRKARTIAKESIGNERKKQEHSTQQINPWLLYANETGEVIDFPGLELVGAVAGETMPHRINKDDCIRAPDGSRLLTLTQRVPVGYSVTDQEVQVLSEDPRTQVARESKRNRSWPPEAVAVSLPSPYVATHYCSFNSLPGGQVLPYFFYAPIGWWYKTSEFLVPALRLDDDPRHDLEHFDKLVFMAKIQEKLDKHPSNRLVYHLSKCCKDYNCLAAVNFFMGRWEMPIPISPTGNTMCVGCPSLRTAKSTLDPLYQRIPFVPTVDEIVELAVEHLSTAPRAIISFGQKCEGEPMMQAKLLRETIFNIRKQTDRGTIHINSNGTKPEEIEMLRENGLDSLRVEVNSVRRSYFNDYVRLTNDLIREGPNCDVRNDESGNETAISPEDAFCKAKESLKIMKRKGGFTSIKYMILPGLNDEQQEVQQLCQFIEETNIDMVQWCNIALDPEYYLSSIRYEAPASAVLAVKLGVRRLIDTIRFKFPRLRHGYYNPCLDARAQGYNLVEA